MFPVPARSAARETVRDCEQPPASREIMVFGRPRHGRRTAAAMPFAVKAKRHQAFFVMAHSASWSSVWSWTARNSHL